MKVGPLIYFLFYLFTIESVLSQALTPGVRNGHCMAYDVHTKTIIVFGGADEKEVKNDTWLYKNEKWRQLKKRGPAKRTFANIVYDPFHKYTFLFGGNKVLFGDSASGNTTLNDTWIFENNKWRQLNTKTSPPARAEASMAFNETNNTVLLFGGYTFIDDNTRERKRLNDTWEFNGTDWKLVSGGGPEPRSGCVMTFDKNFNSCILFGGNIRSSKNNPMWAWDGTKWNPIKTMVEPIYNTSMVFMENKKIMIRYGGYDGNTRIDTTWYYSKTNDWQILKTFINPPARNHACMIYNTEDSSAFLYGGHNGDFVFGDMWKLKDGNWIQVFTTTSLRRIENNH